MSTHDEELVLSRLFQTPALAPTNAPLRAFGVSSQSTEVVLKLLKDNHGRFHIYFNARGMHNHVSHHLLAIYALGATGKVIEAAYGTSSGHQLPAFTSPVTITENNFFDHLGSGDNYNAYLKYFSSVLSVKGVDIGEVLEKYIFSEKFNFDKERKDVGKPQPEMLNRFFAGLLHPMIHVGYGVEFGLGGILAEGLAQTAIHRAETPTLVPESFFDFPSLARLINELPKASLEDKASVPRDKGHIFSIMARMLEDSRLDPVTLDLKDMPMDLVAKFRHVITNCGEVIREYAEQWDLQLTGNSASDASILDEKVEELFWAHVLMYGVGGWVEGKGFLADFVSMHFVTSSIFLSNLIAVLKKSSSKVTFLRAYACFILAWWISRGQSGLSISKFYEATGGIDAEDGAIRVPGPQPTPNEKALKSRDTPCLTPNAWYPLLQSVIVHPDDHICKLLRALAHAASLYGNRAVGHFAHLKGVCGPKFEGVEKLDGTLFVRVARLSMDKLGWMREGQPADGWDFQGFA